MNNCIDVKEWCKKCVDSQASNRPRKRSVECLLSVMILGMMLRFIDANEHKLVNLQIGVGINIKLCLFKFMWIL